LRTKFAKNQNLGQKNEFLIANYLIFKLLGKILALFFYCQKWQYFYPHQQYFYPHQKLFTY
jgi:hypothetical protein